MGGLTRVEGEAEVRLETLPNLFFALFYDIGMVSPEPLALSSTGHAVGAGVHFAIGSGFYEGAS